MIFCRIVDRHYFIQDAKFFLFFFHHKMIVDALLSFYLIPLKWNEQVEKKWLWKKIVVLSNNARYVFSNGENFCPVEDFSFE